MFEDAAYAGLVLSPVSATSVTVAQARRQSTEVPDSEQDLERWQPDWILASSELKKDSPLPPSDVHPKQLTAAAIRKQDD